MTETTATINVTSEPQQATLTIGQEKKFEVTNDTYYDLSVKLNGIKNNKANITIQAIQQEILPEEKPIKEKEKIVKKAEEKIKDILSKWFWVIIVAVLIIIAYIIYMKKFKENL